MMRVAVIGAGIAGASLVAELAPHAHVTLLEAEDHPGYHATGRSAAFWSETYGGPLVQPLTTASRQSLDALGVLGPRGVIHIADRGGQAALEALGEMFEATIAIKRLDRAALAAAIPGLRRGWDAGIAEPSCRDIDVAALHAAFLRAARRAGAVLLTGARVDGLSRRGGAWRVTAGDAALDVDVVVNAAGAWADEVAAMAGARSIGIEPRRRTIAQLAIDPPAPAAMPLVIDAAGSFYFKPEAGGRLWLSPHDETPCPAGDCAADELDVALAIDRLQQVVDWRVLRVERAWAGLRSFAPDRLPVYGYDPDAPGFFWCAGQGGFGIQTAPAAAKLAAALLMDAALDPAVTAIDPTPYLASRFAN